MNKILAIQSILNSDPVSITDVNNIFLFGVNGATTPPSALDENGEPSKAILGGKGQSLHIMANMGMPVPPGFTIATSECMSHLEADDLSQALLTNILRTLKALENETGKQFGSGTNPLILSGRSGAAISMPGMMETVLNIGLNDKTVKALADQTKNPRFAYDSYRRLIQMYGSVVLGIDDQLFRNEIDASTAKYGVEKASDLDANQLQELIKSFLTIYKNENKKFPQNVYEQLKQVTLAVFKSWNNERSKVYRKAENLPDDMGTAVTIQAMVFGNFGDTSGTGVALTRDANNGENKFKIDYLENAQGEDAVDGSSVPLRGEASHTVLKEKYPEAFQQLQTIREALEKTYKCIVEIEFTIQEGKLYLLQAKTSKRQAAAAFKSLVNMTKEGIMTMDEAILKLSQKDAQQIGAPIIDPTHTNKIIGEGIGASFGGAVGVATFSAATALERSNQGIPVILIRRMTSTEDVEAMKASAGLLTKTGGANSHAAVVAKGWQIPAIVGCSRMEISFIEPSIPVANFYDGNGNLIASVKDGEKISLDVSSDTGKVLLGEAPIVEPKIPAEFNEVMAYCKTHSKLRVLANADDPEAAALAHAKGAEGIGLIRTEHMFFDKKSTLLIRKVLLGTPEERQSALDELLPKQTEDFTGIFKAMEGQPVCARLLDPPADEFINKSPEAVEELATYLNKSVEEVEQKINAYHDDNPMMGLRGARLLLMMPELIEMQVRAMVQGAINAKDQGVETPLEIMIPMIMKTEEFSAINTIIHKVAAETLKAAGKPEDYISIKAGANIETPAACLKADKLVEAGAKFFSFGTNDLTQATFQMSRNDYGKMLPQYLADKILPNDPFNTLHEEVVELMKFAIERGRSVDPNLKVGICGEHGGEEKSIAHLLRLGLDYVSCSQARVEPAWLATCQASIRAGR